MTNPTEPGSEIGNGWVPPVLEPLLRHARRPGFRTWIGPGWWALALACHEELVRVDPEYGINAVKEKYGALEFQAVMRPQGDPLTSPVDEITDRYREASETVCEICGRVGGPVTRGSLELTRCQPCWSAALEGDRTEMRRSVRFPGMRSYLYDGVERCADGDYQARNWALNGDFSDSPPDMGNLDFVVHAIFDDSSLEDHPLGDSVGVILIGEAEAEAASELLTVFGAALDGPDASRIIATPAWARTVEAADRLLALMEANDPTLKRTPWPVVPVVVPKSQRSPTARLQSFVRRLRQGSTGFL